LDEAFKDRQDLSSFSGIEGFSIFSGSQSFLLNVRGDLLERRFEGFGMEILSVVGMKVFEDGKVVPVDGECGC